MSGYGFQSSNSSSSSTGTSWSLNGNNNGALKYIGTNDAFDFPVYTNGVEVARFLSTGGTQITNNTGIGAPPSATAVLYVFATGTDTGIYGFSNGASPAGYFETSASASTNGVYITHVSSLSGDALLVENKSTIAGLINVGVRSNSTQSNTGGTNIAGYFTAQNGSFNYAGIFDGYVGIGTTAPTASLQINGVDATAANHSFRANNNLGTNIFYVRNDGVVNSTNGYWINNNKTLNSGGTVDFNLVLWASSVFPTPSSTRNTLVGSNDTGTATVTGSTNTVIGDFTSVSISTRANIVFGAGGGFTSTANGYNIAFAGALQAGTEFSTLTFGATSNANYQAVFGGAGYQYKEWYFGRGISLTSVFGVHDLAFNATSVTAGETDKNATTTNWRIAGGKGTGTGSGTNIVLAVAPPGSTGTVQNALVDLVVVSGVYGNVGINTTPSSSTYKFDVVGASRFQSIATNLVQKTGAYVITSTDFTVECTSGTFTVTLPTAVGINGRIYVVKNSGAGTITLAADGAETIDGSATQPIASGASIMVQSNNSNWIII